MIFKSTQVYCVIGFTTYVYLKPAYFESKIYYRYSRGCCQSALYFQIHLVVKYFELT
jgi:hypothetical protein